MLVAKHKPAKDGSAVFSMLPELYKFVDIYSHQVFPHLAQPEEQALFVTTDGIAFPGGHHWAPTCPLRGEVWNQAWHVHGLCRHEESDHNRDVATGNTEGAQTSCPRGLLCKPAA